MTWRSRGKDGRRSSVDPGGMRTVNVKVERYTPASPACSWARFADTTRCRISVSLDQPLAARAVIVR